MENMIICIAVCAPRELMLRKINIIIYRYTNIYLCVVRRTWQNQRHITKCVCVLCALFHTRWHISFVARWYGMHNEQGKDRGVRATEYVSTISFDNVAQIKRHWAITNEHTKQNDDLDCGNRCAVCKRARKWESTQFMFWLLGPCMCF